MAYKIHETPIPVKKWTVAIASLECMLQPKSFRAAGDVIAGGKSACVCVCVVWLCVCVLGGGFLQLLSLEFSFGLRFIFSWLTLTMDAFLHHLVYKVHTEVWEQ